ncbi:lysylphosphatidylglycerol synthase transmembrane domain-containing protein [Intestinibacter sp.]|uniref:lysylphosphatidylglycerol synthase transmembrane domain-containing protein n=1 Tax=Intestinibacter sp. TaxID=1965304 RepID=UPI002A9161BC|nr:lysylphosphatidylglycerol synthase transmembrane domain-containing protein [Intestinibacter sp.]MDY5212147.1 lysylphosphatidylglycerol synthase transmembrane domain-containing protein [Intestinibacter sp.]
MKDYKNLFFKILKNGGLFLILIIFTFYFVFRDMDLNTVAKTISNVNRMYILIAATCMCIFLLCEASNFRRNLTALGYETNLLKCINYSVQGFFFSSITPSASGGQPMQAYQMYRDDIKVSHSTLVLFVEFIFFQTVTIMYSIIGFISQRSLLDGKVNSLMVLFTIGLVCNFTMLMLLVLVLFYSKGVKKITDLLVRFLKFCRFKKADLLKEKVYSIVDDYKDCAMYIIKNKGIMIKTFITKCVQIFALHSIPYWIYRSFGFNEYSIFVFIGVQAVLFISVSALPLPGSVGVSESGFLTLFKLLFPVTVLNEAMLLSRGVSCYLFVFLCGVFILVKGFRDSRAKRLARIRAAKEAKEKNVYKQRVVQQI